MPHGPRLHLRWPPLDKTSVQARGPHPLSLEGRVWEKRHFWTGSPEAGTTPCWSRHTSWARRPVCDTTHDKEHCLTRGTPKNGDRGTREPRGLWGCAPHGEAAASCHRLPATPCAWSVLGYLSPAPRHGLRLQSQQGWPSSGCGGHRRPVCRVGGPPRSRCVDSLAASTAAGSRACLAGGQQESTAG